MSLINPMTKLRFRQRFNRRTNRLVEIILKWIQKLERELERLDREQDDISALREQTIASLEAQRQAALREFESMSEDTQERRKVADNLLSNLNGLRQ